MPGTPELPRVVHLKTPKKHKNVYILHVGELAGASKSDTLNVRACGSQPGTSETARNGLPLPVHILSYLYP